MSLPNAGRATDISGAYFPQRSVVLIGVHGALRTRLERHFDEQGWHVATAVAGPEGRAVARRLGADLVVLVPDLPCESGWLTCAKLRYEVPAPAVIVVLDEDDWRGRQRAHFLGARVQLLQDEYLDGVPRRLLRPVPVTVAS